MKSFSLEIVTPTRMIVESEVTYARCPGIDGEFGIMANHREGIIALAIGEVKATISGKNEFFAVSGGFAEITKEKVELLVETVELSTEIDTSRAEESIQRMKARFAEAEKNEERNQQSYDRAKNRLKVSGH